MSAAKLLGVLLVLATALLCGCDDDDTAVPKPTSTAPATAAATLASASATAAPHAPTGMLSESEFKALHLLRGDDAPPPQGEMIDVGGGKAYRSLPKSRKPPLPAVIVIHEWWGLNQHIKYWSDRLAEEGYAALAVDLYQGKVAETPDDAMKLMKAVDEKQARATLLAAFEELSKNDAIQAQKRASIGWCFGGKWSLELALDAPTLDAAVVYYGHVEADAQRLAKLQTPLLAIFGNKDTGIPPKMVEKFEFGLEQAGDKDYKILRYDAEHAFANPSSARYDEQSATAAWQQTRSFLSKHLRP
jgi:carboxymethylenebutenolidase